MDVLDWRNVLTDDFEWPGAGTDEDPGEAMDFGKNCLRTLEMLEALKDYRSPESHHPRLAKDEPGYYSDGSDIVLDEGETLEDALAQLDLLQQDMYRFDASCYRSEKYLGPDKEQRFCIGPGHKEVSWTELSSGYSWICVSANEKACAVTMRNPINKLPANKDQLSSYTVVKGALADMIADTPTSFRKIEGFRSGKFVVVSVPLPASDQELELRSLEKKHHCLFRFLEEKLDDCSTLSYKETEQIAICALKVVLGREFIPYNIEVCGWEGEGNLMNGMCFRMPAKGVREALTRMV